MQAQSSLRLCGVPKNLNLSSFDLGSALNPEPASDSAWQSNLEPEQCRLGKHTRREQGKPSVAETLQAHASVIFCSVRPSPQYYWTSEPKKVSTTAPLCQGGN